MGRGTACLAGLLVAIEAKESDGEIFMGVGSGGLRPLVQLSQRRPGKNTVLAGARAHLPAAGPVGSEA